MLRTALLASAFAVCAAAPAFAAPAQAWTGFYVGVNAGYGGDSFKYPAHATLHDTVVEEEIDGDDTLLNASGSASQTSSGYVAGGQVGYDHQFGNWVVGAVADIDATGIEGRTAISAASAGFFDASVSAHAGSKIDYLGTVRARVGMPVADGRFMPFVTAGMAYGQITSSASATFALGSDSPTTFSASHRENRVGWTVGAGADYAVTDHIRFGVEYLYTDLGTHTLAAGSVGLGLMDGMVADGDETLSGRVGVKSTANIVRVTLSYKFGG